VSEVVPRLFVGGLDSARSLRFIAEKRITAVLSLCDEFVPAQDRTLRIWHARVAVAEEHADLLVELPRAVAFVAQALAQGHGVLVHSVHGQSRAPAVVAAYRAFLQRRRAARADQGEIVMQALNMDATAAMDRVRKAHEPTWILPGVQEQLVLFKLCNFVPMPGVGCYDSWRNKMLNRGLK
jgi:dual specificity phosphatase 12